MTAQEQLWCIICSSVGLRASFLHEMEHSTEIPELAKTQDRKEPHGESLWWLLSLGLTAMPLGCMGMTQLILPADLTTSPTVPNQYPCPGMGLLTPSHQHRNSVFWCSTVNWNLISPWARTDPQHHCRLDYALVQQAAVWLLSKYFKLRCAILTNNLFVTDQICCHRVSATWLLLLLYLAPRDRQQVPIKGTQRADVINIKWALKNTLCVEAVLKGQDFLRLRLSLQIVFSLASLGCLKFSY